jgi:hypothetical protein
MHRPTQRRRAPPSAAHRWLRASVHSPGAVAACSACEHGAGAGVQAAPPVGYRARAHGVMSPCLVAEVNVAPSTSDGMNTIPPLDDQLDPVMNQWVVTLVCNP